MEKAQTQPTLVPEAVPPTPPEVARTVEILEKAAQTTSAPLIEATEVAMKLAAELHTAIGPKSS